MFAVACGMAINADEIIKNKKLGWVEIASRKIYCLKSEFSGVCGYIFDNFLKVKE